VFIIIIIIIIIIITELQYKAWGRFCLGLIADPDKKIWEELIANFPLKRHGPHRELHVQQFFYCCALVAEICLLSRCVAGIREDTHTDRLFGGIYEVRH
jgi:hypothetical protein